MKQEKYAFIFESATMTPEDFTLVHQNESDYSLLAAVKSVKMAGEFAKKLVGEGIVKIDLCGAFNDETARKVGEEAGGRADIRYARYKDDDGKRVDELESLNEYGIILMDSSLTESEWTYKKSEEFNTTIVFVGNLDGACKAAKKMVDDGIIFIEMCRWFDEEKATTVIDAIDNAVPVGFCG